MPFNGAGTFVRVYNWTQDKINGIKIRADRMDTETDGIATGLSLCITRDGQSPPTTNIPMGGFKLTGLGAATATTDAMRLGQSQNNDGRYVEVAGADTYTANPSPALTAYATGQGLLARFSAANSTTGVTMNWSGLGAKSVTKNGNNTLAVGDITTGSIKLLVFNGTNIEMIGGAPSSTFGVTDGGLKTANFSALANTKYRMKGTANAITAVLPGATGSAGDVMILMAYGAFGGQACGTINGIAQTIQFEQQTFPLTYSLTSGWV